MVCISFTDLYIHYCAEKAVLKAKSPDPNYCFGFESANTDGYYITTVKIATGLVSLEGLGGGDDLVLPGIVAYDRAERNEAYIGQVNMITVSSFSGPYSAIWGYDMAKVPDDILRNKDDPKYFEVNEGKRKIPVYSMEPLIEATEALFGTEHARNFPVVAGGHLPTAVKSCDSVDSETGDPAPGWVWCFLSLAIAERRAVDSSLFVEDAGFISDLDEAGHQTGEQVEEYLKKKAKQVAHSQILCGRNQSVPFTEIFMTWRKRYTPKYSFGTALTCAPYVTLAKNVYPKMATEEASARKLCQMSLEDWKSETPLNEAPQPTTV